MSLGELPAIAFSWSELLRITLTPLTVLGATYAIRRWGHALGGQLVGLPLTTGPFLIITQVLSGNAATIAAGMGVVAGKIGPIAFCFTYARLANRFERWPVSLIGAWLVAIPLVGLVGIIQQGWLAAVVVIGAAFASLATWPKHDATRQFVKEEPAWELPLKAGLSGILVIVLTGLAKQIGHHVAGLIVAFPVIMSVLSPITDKRQGRDARLQLLRGTTVSAPGTVVLGLCLAFGIGRFGPLLAFIFGFVGVLITNRLMNRIQRMPARTG